MSDKILRISYPLEAYTALVRECDELRERLAAAERSAREMHIAADQFLRERDELRAQADGFYNEVQMLRAENERLRAENATLTDHNDSLQAAVRKLNRLLEAALDSHKEC